MTDFNKNSESHVRKGRKKYSGMGDWYPEREVEDNIISSMTEEVAPVVEVEPEKISEDKKEFDKLAFAEKLYSVRDKTQERLEKEFPDQNMQIKIGELGRSMDTQIDYLKKGATGTTLSLHNVDAAADYQIFVNGEYQQARNRDEGIDYYRILGDVAQKEGLFWGFGDDPGHVAYDRFVSDIVEDYPSLAEEPVVKNWWSEREGEARLMYKPTLELLDSLYDESPERQYVGDETREQKMAKRIMITGIPEPKEPVMAETIKAPFDLSIFGK